MPRLTPNSPPASRARSVVRRLRVAYPDATTSLGYRSAWELLVAVILSAQCTDARVNEVTPRLFARLPTPETVIAASVDELESLIRPTGFYRNKARSIRGAAQYLLEHHHGVVPRTTRQLIRVPGVGRKTAAVVLAEAYGVAEGIAVDTHAGRLSLRLGLTDTTDAVRAERQLMLIVPKRSWIEWTHLLIAHGRAVCRARTPQCATCVLADICPTGRDRLAGNRRADTSRRGGAALVTPTAARAPTRGHPRR
jgi:endonuclease III